MSAPFRPVVLLHVKYELCGGTGVRTENTLYAKSFGVPTLAQHANDEGSTMARSEGDIFRGTGDTPPAPPCSTSFIYFRPSSLRAFLTCDVGLPPDERRLSCELEPGGQVSQHFHKNITFSGSTRPVASRMYSGPLRSCTSSTGSEMSGIDTKSLLHPNHALVLYHL